MWTYIETDYDNDYLQHHGILGQKWGVRRFQNEDGTLTSDGRRRYLDANRNRSVEKYEHRYRRDNVKISDDTKKAIDALNESRANKESLLKRYELRKQAREMLRADRGEGVRSKGEMSTKRILKRSGITALTAIPTLAGAAATKVSGSIMPLVGGLVITGAAGTATGIHWARQDRAVRQSIKRTEVGSGTYQERIQNRDRYRR